MLSLLARDHGSAADRRLRCSGSGVRSFSCVPTAAAAAAAARRRHASGGCFGFGVVAVVVHAGRNPRVWVVPDSVHVDSLGVSLWVGGFEMALASDLKGPFPHFFQDAVSRSPVQGQGPEHRRNVGFVHVAVSVSKEEEEEERWVSAEDKMKARRGRKEERFTREPKVCDACKEMKKTRKSHMYYPREHHA